MSAGLKNWVEYGIRNYGNHPERQIDYFKLQSPDSRAVLQRERHGTLFADVEGLALFPQGRKGGWLVASSQGDNAYAVYRLPDMAPAGRFRIAAGAFGATEETDGIALAAGRFGPLYPGGLLVVQDGDNAPHAQNFKLVSWQDLLQALGLPLNR